MSRYNKVLGATFIFGFCGVLGIMQVIFNIANKNIDIVEMILLALILATFIYLGNELDKEIKKQYENDK